MSIVPTFGRVRRVYGGPHIVEEGGGRVCVRDECVVVLVEDERSRLEDNWHSDLVSSTAQRLPAIDSRRSRTWFILQPASKRLLRESLFVEDKRSLCQLSSKR